MAIIPRSKPGVSVNATPLRAVDVGGEAVGHAQAAVGAGIANLGQGISKFAAEYEKEQDELDEFDMKMKLTRLEGEQAMRQHEYDNSITGRGEGHTPNRVAEFDQVRTQFLEGVKGEKNKQVAALHLEGMRAKFGQQSFIKEQSQQGQWKEDEVTNLVVGQIIPNVTHEEESLLNASAQVEAMLEGTPMPDERRERVRKVAADAFLERWVDQQGADAEEKAKEVIKRFGAGLPTPAIRDLPNSGIKAKPRKSAIEGIVVHHTSGSSLEGAISHGAKTGTGTNYYIDRDGSVVRAVSEGSRTSHIREPGHRYRTPGKNDNLTNDNTIGIEVVAPNSKALTPEQKASLQSLLHDISTRNKIDAANVVGHGDIQGGAHGNKEADEGVEFASLFRSGGWTPTRVADADGSSQTPTNQTMARFVRGLTMNLDTIHQKTKKAREFVEAQGFLAGILDGKVSFNPHNKDQRDKVDLAMKDDLVSKALYDGNEGALNAAVSVAHKLNYVPDDVSAAVRGLMASDDETKQALGYRAAASIINRNPRAFDAVPGGDSVTKEVEGYAALVEGGLAPHEAIARMAEMNSPEWKKLEAERKKELDSERDGIIPNLTEKQLAEGFKKDLDTSWWSDPALGKIGPEGTLAMGQFRALVRENYIRYGDEETAIRVAHGQMRRSWGVSNIGGGQTITRYPVEARYPKLPDGSSEWISEQLSEYIGGAIGQAPDGMFLRADSITQQELATGKPSYMVMYKDPKDGITKALPRWRPDFERAEAAYHAKQDEARAAAVDKVERREALKGFVAKDAGSIVEKIKAGPAPKGERSSLRELGIRLRQQIQGYYGSHPNVTPSGGR